MPSLFAEYCLEKGMLIAETANGFMSAYVHGGVCMVDNFFVKKERRGSPTCIRLADAVIKIAKERGCGTFCAEVYKIDPVYRRNLHLFRHFGMEPVEETEYKIIVSKSISGEPFYARRPRATAAH